MTVRDANSVFVAVPVNGHFLREISGQPYIIWSILPSGLGQTDPETFQFFHLTANCTDARLLYGNGTVYIFGNTGYYTPTTRDVVPLSAESFTTGQDVSQPGQCTNFNAGLYPLGAVSTVDISSWGLTPPFSWHLE